MNMHIQPTSSKNPHPVDVAVGANVRRLRTAKGMSQEKLGEALGITFQQIQKNEKGTNRIGASRIAMLAAALDCNITDIFKGVGIAEGEIETPPPVDPRVHKATRILQTIPAGRLDQALKILATFSEG